MGPFCIFFWYFKCILLIILCCSNECFEKEISLKSRGNIVLQHKTLNRGLFTVWRAKEPIKKYFFINVLTLLCSAVGLAGCWGLSQPRTFPFCKDRGKTLWRKSWSASKHLAKLKGMRDPLLWKLGWAPQTVQIALLGSTGKYPAYYHGDSVSIWKQLTIFHSFNGKLQRIVPLAVCWLSYFWEYLVG